MSSLKTSKSETKKVNEKVLFLSQLSPLEESDHNHIPRWDEGERIFPQILMPLSWKNVLLLSTEICVILFSFERREYTLVWGFIAWRHTISLDSFKVSGISRVECKIASGIKCYPKLDDLTAPTQWEGRQCIWCRCLTNSFFESQCIMTWKMFSFESNRFERKEWRFSIRGIKQTFMHWECRATFWANTCVQNTQILVLLLWLSSWASIWSLQKFFSRVGASRKK